MQCSPGREALGPFFDVDRHSPGESAASPWQPLEQLVTDTATMQRRVDAVHTVLAGRGNRGLDLVEPRVAASIAHGGLVSRLVSPALGCAVVCAHVPDMAAGTVWWQDTIGGPYPLSLSSNEPARGEPDGLVDAIRATVMTVVEAISAVIETTYDVSPLVLAGNTVAAINGAALTIAARDLDLADRSFGMADMLRAVSGLDSEQCPTGPEFRRNSCCLAYRLNPAHRELCGDCVLR